MKGELTQGTGTAIGAVNSSDYLRIYTQDISSGIRESLYGNEWESGRIIAGCKVGSPIAATSIGLSGVRCLPFHCIGQRALTPY
jgi:hypothetical protein